MMKKRAPDAGEWPAVAEACPAAAHTAHTHRQLEEFILAGGIGAWGFTSSRSPDARDAQGAQTHARAGSSGIAVVLSQHEGPEDLTRTCFVVF